MCMYGSTAVCALAGLLYPSATIMDVNIGAALWMAAQAEGKLTVIKGSAVVTSPSHPAPHDYQPSNPQPEQQQQQGCSAEDGATVSDPHQQQQQGCIAKGSVIEEQQQQHKLSPQADCVPQEHGVSCQHLPVSGQPIQGCAGQTQSRKEQDRRPARKQQAAAEMQQALQQEQQCDTCQHRQVHHCRQRWYRSAARVVLLGHGADEQHAGYGRHRTSFRNQVLLCFSQHLS